MTPPLIVVVASRIRTAIGGEVVRFNTNVQFALGVELVGLADEVAARESGGTPISRSHTAHFFSR
jgi:hypothetical protein